MEAEEYLFSFDQLVCPSPPDQSVCVQGEAARMFEAGIKNWKRERLGLKMRRTDSREWGLNLDRVGFLGNILVIRKLFLTSRV